jgi:hypothetical protein
MEARSASLGSALLAHGVYGPGRSRGPTAEFDRPVCDMRIDVASWAASPYRRQVRTP